MTTESYLNHPTFGLLYRICFLDNSQELFATLYAQRLFFLVSVEKQVIQFEPVSRADARLALENRLRSLRRHGQSEELTKLQASYKQTFH
ncbi:MULTISPECIES: transcriptional coactivator PipX [unclassified Leptolyngbya]|uniref:transcriptional coactivator PipX n=1 Tax=unclassified Leptolyngbya TaxID=2650499 RepID=UPI00168A14CA|nr:MULTISPECIES: PipX family protein [unclassified Leptolyngbya]MBD1910563.1 PipX family protein [Leptolyngbya sp. FACHB-8]MBD2153934.1 PipX family protein [Leptolyngbya sp. FACHB-16]